ncbi:g6658 [Coccomyxa viridis]|uniref:G6658 protein n=1 Tax=Coccomyxa viridis TaxID=1274662 RepID=A0ABP1FX51_9CHLO
MCPNDPRTGAGRKRCLSLGKATATAVRRSVCLAAVSITLPGAWPVLEVLSVLPLLPAELQQGASSQHLSVPAVVRSAASSYSSIVIGFTVAKFLVCKLMPDAARTCRMWRQFLPIYLRCKWTAWRYQESRGCPSEVVEQKWAARHEKEGQAVHDMLLDLSGLYVKSAQILASKRDFMPEPWCRRLASMFDSMPPKPWAHVARALQKDLAVSSAGKLMLLHGQQPTMASLFESVNKQPMASASIAQVHAAQLSKEVLRDLGWRWPLGSDVVLKVQHDNMRCLMDSDVRNLGRLAAFVRDSMPFDAVPILEEMRDTVPKEFDFLREAKLMQVMAARAKAAGIHGVLIPEPLMALSSKGLLVMQRMEGVPVSRLLLQLQLNRLEARSRAALQAATISLIKHFGCMMLQYGLFQADPHPGNLLLQEDGTLVLLDFGQCKALTAERQAALARLVIAMDQGWPADVAQATKGMGLDFRAASGGPADPLTISTVASIIFDTRALPEALVSPLADNALIKTIPLEHFPRDLFMIGRSLMILRGLTHSQGMDVQAASLWRPYAEAALKLRDIAVVAKVNAGYDEGH